MQALLIECNEWGFFRENRVANACVNGWSGCCMNGWKWMLYEWKQRHGTTRCRLEVDFDGDHSVRIQKIHSRADDATIVGSLVRTRRQRRSGRDALRHVIAEHFHTIDIRDNSRGIENTKVVGSQVGEGTHFLAEVLGSRDGLGPVSTNVASPVGYDRDVRLIGDNRCRILSLGRWSWSDWWDTKCSVVHENLCE